SRGRHNRCRPCGPLKRPRGQRPDLRRRPLPTVFLPAGSPSIRASRPPAVPERIRICGSMPVGRALPPVAARAPGRTRQTAQRAIMTWQQFNVGKNTSLYFDQRGGNSANGNDWVALNRIDATGSPSQILGQIKADGTLLVINPNGIIFGGGSQINVHTLIA